MKGSGIATHVTQDTRRKQERHNQEPVLCQEFRKNIQLRTVSNKMCKCPQKTKTKQRKKVDISHNTGDTGDHDEKRNKHVLMFTILCFTGSQWRGGVI